MSILLNRVGFRVFQKAAYGKPWGLPFIHRAGSQRQFYQDCAASTGKPPTQQESPKHVTASELAQFRNEGFVVMKNVFSIEEKEQLPKFVEEIRHWGFAPGQHMQYFEKVQARMQLCRTENYLDFHPGLSKMVGNNSKPAQIAAELLGQSRAGSEGGEASASVFKERINYKLAGGGGFAPHQDAPAWSGGDPTAEDAELDFMQFTLNMNIAIDKMFLQNGGLEVVPIGQDKEVKNDVVTYADADKKKPRYPQNADGTISDTWCKEQNWVEVVLEPGDVLFFSLHIAHRSGKNLTNASRRAVYITYAAQEMCVNGQTKSWDIPAERRNYYTEYRKKFPPAGEQALAGNAKGEDRETKKNYDEGHKVYNWATPISMEQPNEVQV